MIAGIWSFTPNEIRVQAGSTVTFVATSHDLSTVFTWTAHNVNVMLLPGRDRARDGPLRPDRGSTRSCVTSTAGSPTTPCGAR